MSVASERELIDQELLKEIAYENYLGDDWWQISDAEGDVFGLSVFDLPLVTAVHKLYYDALKITSLIPDDRVESLRDELPWLPECQVERQEFLRFAKLFGVSVRVASAFFDKYFWWDVRHGIGYFEDEQPAYRRE